MIIDSEQSEKKTYFLSKNKEVLKEKHPGK